MDRLTSDEDRDIKIADFSSDKKKIPENLEMDSDRLFYHKRNGNAEKARLLGSSIVREMIVGDINARLGISDESKYPCQPQIRLLAAFAAVIGLQTQLPDELLAQMALSAFYETIQTSLPAFYEDIEDSASFSFFFLAYRRGGDVERNIGRAFAAVCDADGDEVFAELGETLYSRVLMMVEQKAAAAAFL